MAGYEGSNDAGPHFCAMEGQPQYVSESDDESANDIGPMMPTGAGTG